MNRDRRVHLMVSKTEFDEWSKVARERDLPLSALIRHCMNALCSGLIDATDVYRQRSKDDK